ncbi:glycoside hydrolase family 43 protein [Microbacterium sp. Bi121]|uniref:glycoside hydrolase family 43 protein n=1 Tax=Microbacterium sp. Bi121 TaxID=2822348 RepID=UPI001DC5D2EC|nr:glycoside hydrolase family 43 protein [Microbacterium sp. Bi121]CAH0215697.1 Non-reducing end alpha-L-arabinofuranosidase BoGH43A [Microbacterium sp. Bi121]
MTTLQGQAPSDSALRADERAVSAAEHPIIPGFHPDPSICRVGDDYYIAHSSFEYHPGVPLWHSTDLVSWNLVGHALADEPRFPAGRAGANGGVYAPTLRHHDGRFWMITTDVSGGGGQVVTSAPSITGPWGPATVISGIIGIDPDLAWDEDGTCYVTYSSDDDSAPDIAQVRVDLERGEIIGEPYTICRGMGMAYPEGPHIFRRGDWWYLLYSEGGTERGHCVSIARATAPDGPFILSTENPIFTRRSMVFPVQNTGHADIVECADGSWAMVYLGVRARGTTPMFHVNGRETFVAGIAWEDGWPVLVPDAYSFTPDATDFTDRFDSDALDLRWISPGAEVTSFARAVPGRGIQISSASSPNGAPAMLAARTTDLEWRFEADVFGLDAGGADAVAADAAAGGVPAVRLRMDEAHWAEIRVDDGRAVLHVRIGPAERIVRDEAPVSAAARGVVTLRIEAASPTHRGPDDLIFTVVDDAGERELDRIDGRYLSTEVAGGFLGRTIGLRADGAPGGAPVVFTEVRYTGAKGSTR